MQLLIVITDESPVHFLLDVAGHLRLFGRIEDDVVFLYLADADIEVHRYLRDYALDVPADFVQAAFEFIHIRNDHEVVVRYAAHQILPELLFQEAGEMDKKFVPLLIAVRVIVEFHPDKIQEDKRGDPARLANFVRKAFTAHAAVI